MTTLEVQDPTNRYCISYVRKYQTWTYLNTIMKYIPFIWGVYLNYHEISIQSSVSIPIKSEVIKLLFNHGYESDWDQFETVGKTYIL